MDKISVEKLQEQLKAEQEAHKETKKLLKAEQGSHEETNKQLEDLKLEFDAAILKERARNPKKVVTVKHKNKKYVFDREKVRWKGNIVPVEDVAKDPEYLDHILSLEGQNILKSDD